MLRRRTMMGASATQPQYITDGLVFHLDCADCNSGSWVDRIGGVVFDLYGITFDGYGGVVFDGTSASHGVADNSVIYSANTSTIEVVVANTRVSGNNFFFCCGKTNAVTRSLLAASQNTNLVFSCNGAFYIGIMHSIGKHTIAFGSQKYICDGVESTKGGGLDGWGISGFDNNATLGCRNTATDKTPCTIYQVRIYNRFLTTNEILYNQRIDNERFNLGLTL